MALSTSPLAYDDCFQALDLAIEDGKGCRVPVESYDAALFLRMRIHQARKLNREENLNRYDSDHQLYGRSVYDKLVVRIKAIPINGTTKHYVYVEAIPGLTPDAEGLSDLEEDTATEVKVEEKIQVAEQTVSIKRRI